MQKNKIFSGLLTNYLNYIVIILLQLGLAPVVLSVAGKETMGAYAILSQVIGYVALIDLGFSFSGDRFLAQAYVSNKEELNDVYSVYRSYDILRGVVTAIILFCISVFSSDFLVMSIEKSIQFRNSLIILGIWSAISGPFTIYSGYLNSTNNMKYTNLTELAGKIFQLIFSLVLVYFGMALLGLVIGKIIADCVKFGGQHFLLDKKVGFPEFNFTLRRSKKIKEIFTLSLYGFLITVAIKLVLFTDNLVIGMTLGATFVSIYHLTLLPGNSIAQFATRISDNFTSSLNYLYANQKIEEVRKTYIFIVKITALVLTPIVFGIYFFSASVVDFWVGKDLYAGDSTVLWFSLFIFTLNMAHTPNAILLIFGKLKYLSFMALFEGIVNLGLSLYLVGYYGISGVIFASFIANIPTSVYIFYEAHRLIKLKNYVYPSFIKYFVVVIPFVLLYYLINMYLVFDSSLLSLLLKGIPYSIIFMIALYFSILNKRERGVILQLFRKLNLTN